MNDELQVATGAAICARSALSNAPLVTAGGTRNLALCRPKQRRRIGTERRLVCIYKVDAVEAASALDGRNKSSLRHREVSSAALTEQPEQLSNHS